jgi:hypothetical protein
LPDGSMASADVCVICLEPVSHNTGVTDCGHSFCSRCVQELMFECSTYPICRPTITSIRLFYRSFFMGDVISVQTRDQEMTIPPDLIPIPPITSSATKLSTRQARGTEPRVRVCRAFGFRSTVAYGASTGSFKVPFATEAFQTGPNPKADSSGR